MTARMMTAFRAGLQAPITGRRVLTWMVLFFGVVFTVNGVFVYLALDTWPGLSTERAYEEGLSYNKTLADAAEQNARGWQSRAAMGPPSPKGRVLTVQMADARGAAVGGLEVEGVLRRPVGTGVEVAVTLAEERPGLYGALVRLPALGRWRLQLTVADAAGVTYRMVHELRAGP